MINSRLFDAIIIGGSYSGLAAGMALGRALRNILIIDEGRPCNIQTPHSHNFLTQDGKTPQQIATLAREQVANYQTIRFIDGRVTHAAKTGTGFQLHTGSGETFEARKLIFATGIRDIMPAIEGYAACWGVSVLHCPYCHGYEVKHQTTGILSNGDHGFEFASLIFNWTKDLTLFTNGPSTLKTDHSAKIKSHGIRIVEAEILKIAHSNGQIQSIIFKDGTTYPLKVLYARSSFEQHCEIPQALGCELTEEGYIKVDVQQKTTVPGVYACGDNTTRMRSVANAVGMGTTTGAMVNREIVLEDF